MILKVLITFSSVEGHILHIQITLLRADYMLYSAHSMDTMGLKSHLRFNLSTAAPPVYGVYFSVVMLEQILLVNLEMTSTFTLYKRELFSHHRVLKMYALEE